MNVDQQLRVKRMENAIENDNDERMTQSECVTKTSRLGDKVQNIVDTEKCHNIVDGKVNHLLEKAFQPSVHVHDGFRKTDVKGFASRIRRDP